MSGDRGIMDPVGQPWGFDGVRREYRAVRGDSRVFYVDPNHAEATDSNSGEDPAHPLATIQRAVTLARADKGDTIYVMQNDGWQYGPGTGAPIQESVVIPITKSGLRLVGVGGGSPGVYWQPGADNEFCLTVLAMDFIVEHFLFTGFGMAGANGVYALWGAPVAFADNIDIFDCTFDGDIDTAIQLEYVWYGKVEGCHFQDCDAYGIYVNPVGSGAAHLTIRDNWFKDCGTSAIAGRGIEDSRISGNWVYNAAAQAAGAATNEGFDLTNVGASSNIVSDNWFSCVLAAGPGNYDDLNTAGSTDAWVNCHCMDGDAVLNPA